VCLELGVRRFTLPAGILKFISPISWRALLPSTAISFTQTCRYPASYVISDFSCNFAVFDFAGGGTSALRVIGPVNNLSDRAEKLLELIFARV
jgi:hypothetical protein